MTDTREYIIEGADYCMALGWLLREAKFSIHYLEKKAIISPVG